MKETIERSMNYGKHKQRIHIHTGGSRDSL